MRSEKAPGVHRGRVDNGRISLLQRLFPFLQGIQIEGSQAKGPRGSRYTDLDISASPPPGLTPEQLRELERKIQDQTGIDFYFRDE